LVVPLDVVGPHLALAVHLGLEVGETGRQHGTPGGEAPVLSDALRHLGEAVAAHVEIAEGEAAALVLRPAGRLLARHVHPGELEIAAHRPSEAIHERLVLGEVGGAEVAHVAVLLSGSREAGGRVPSRYSKARRDERSMNSWMLSAKRYALS